VLDSEGRLAGTAFFNSPTADLCSNLAVASRQPADTANGVVALPCSLGSMTSNRQSHWSPDRHCWEPPRSTVSSRWLQPAYLCRDLRGAPADDLPM